MKFAAMVPYLMALVGVGLGASRIVPAMLGWVVCALGVLLGAGTALVILLTAQWHHGTLALIAALPAAIAIPKVFRDLNYPRINDVATDGDNPPAFEAAQYAKPNAGRDMSWPAKNTAIVRRGYPELRPLILDEPPENVLQRARELAEAQSGWTVTHCDTDELRLEGEVATSFFRFVDDFIVVVSRKGDRTRVDMRSKSREGLVDAGANARRIRTFLGMLATGQPKA